MKSLVDFDQITHRCIQKNNGQAHLWQKIAAGIHGVSAQMLNPMAAITMMNAHPRTIR